MLEISRSPLAWMEGFLRPLFGLVPFLRAVEKHYCGSFILEGIINGTNPESEEFWGHLQKNLNSNILYARTEIPTLEGVEEVGETWLACIVLGIRSEQEAIESRKIFPVSEVGKTISNYLERNSQYI